MKKRIEDRFGTAVSSAIQMHGWPNEIHSARRLFLKDPFEFERWAVTLVDGQPNERGKQHGDRGIDGVIRFAAELDRVSGRVEKFGRSLVSVKGGKQLNPAMVRDLKGTVDREKAELGLLLTLDTPTKGMLEEAASFGTYEWAWNGQRYPRAQIVTVGDLLEHRGPRMPTAIRPYVSADRLKIDAGQLSIF
jgi:site-specific DNA-methyltransferase (adenine-specific)